MEPIETLRYSARQFIIDITRWAKKTSLYRCCIHIYIIHYIIRQVRGKKIMCIIYSARGESFYFLKANTCRALRSKEKRKNSAAAMT